MPTIANVTLDRTVLTQVTYRLPPLPDALLNDSTGKSESLTAFSTDELKAIGEVWTQGLIDHAADIKRREDTNPVRPVEPQP